MRGIRFGIALGVMCTASFAPQATADLFESVEHHYVDSGGVKSALGLVLKDKAHGIYLMTLRLRKW